jgi:hypothetical protein
LKWIGVAVSTFHLFTVSFFTVSFFTVSFFTVSFFTVSFFTVSFFTVSFFTGSFFTGTFLPVLFYLYLFSDTFLPYLFYRFPQCSSVMKLDCHIVVFMYCISISLYVVVVCREAMLVGVKMRKTK